MSQSFERTRTTEVVERGLHLSRVLTCQEGLPIMDRIEPDVVT